MGVCLEQVTEARQTLEGRTDRAHLKGQDGNMQLGSGALGRIWGFKAVWVQGVEILGIVRDQNEQNGCKSLLWRQRWDVNPKVCSTCGDPQS